MSRVITAIHYDMNVQAYKKNRLQILVFSISFLKVTAL